MDAEAALSTAAIVVLLVLTVLAMILGELVPKSLALQDPTRTALLTVLPMQWSLRLFAPSIALLNGSGVLLLKLLGVASTGHRHVHSPEEIELLIAESRDGGLLEPLEQVRLHRALRLGLRTARQLMVPRERLAALDAGDAVRRRPAARGDEPVQPPAGLPRHARQRHRHPPHQGRRARLHQRACRAKSIAALLRPIVRVRETMPADRLLAFLRERRSHHALVEDERRTRRGPDHARGCRRRAARRACRTSSRSRSCGRCCCRTAACGCQARCGWIRRRPCSAPGKAADETVAAHIATALGRMPDTGERVTVDGVEVEIEVVEGSATRAR